MEILVHSDPTTLSYWLNWSFLICAIWVLTPMLIASYLIWKYEFSVTPASVKRRSQQESAAFVYDDKVWRPCLKQIHPLWLLIFRAIAFFLLLGTLIADGVVNGGSILYHYYTQWTLILVTIYFGLGSLFSMYGCYQHFHVQYVGIDAEQGLHVPLTYQETAYKVTADKTSNHLGKNGNFHMGIFCHAFQVIFQMCGGAVTLTDFVYWSVIFPFLTVKDYDSNYRFPWFRISYFILWTGTYVIFQWILHACTSLWWPYPFLDLSLPYAPLWYLLVALMHIPCYCVFALIVESKHFILSRCFPRSYQGLR
ncbi:uncharacterized protein LOC127803427 isoform X2 [Diospyros lotus]|uniref:uncharacterized protein LOC127803427 isoform X2 n=1 Tax=Diospyros lotus TaxID=55363 RepID=UPI00225A5E58|nr:uncharacterized protein LOC127803427 isoform X2 [Diospyros lotus]